MPFSTPDPASAAAHSARSVDAAELDRQVRAVGQIAAVPAILEIVCRTTGLGFAAIARVTEDRWIACAVRDEIAFGLETGGELPVETTICHEVRASGETVVIDCVADDATYRQHPTPAMYGFQSYIAVPIRRLDGTLFGTLCAIDPKPAQLSGTQIVGTIGLFANLIAFHIDAQERLDASEAALLGERRVAELREQFIAVLGHDLRNPLASIDAAARLLERQPARAAVAIGGIRNSVRRMATLIEDVLDLARARLGGGIPVHARDDVWLGPVLEQVTDELRLGWPGRRIDMRFDLDRAVTCDPGRIGQVISNLVGNALKHGATDQAVRVIASTGSHGFELAVCNGGAPIPAATIQRLFQPFFRGSGSSDHQGLGLGLYICSEIVRAHRGTLSVVSTAEETRFTVRLPLD